MNILIACDSFKGAAKAEEVCDAIAKGIHQVTSANVLIQPMADGGEGTASILGKSRSATSIMAESFDPLFRPMQAHFFLDADSNAFIDLATCSGMQLLMPEELNPNKTTTYGTGVLMKAAIAQGAKKIILGLGGAATNDGGIGLLLALGFTFKSDKGYIIKGVGGDLIHLNAISSSTYWRDRKIPVEVLCDVQSPLFGKSGAAYLYAAQKGATLEMIATLDKGLRQYAKVISESIGNYHELPGTGASGGTSFGCKALLDATLYPGVQRIMQYVGLEDKIKKVDLIITGEGKLDHQTLEGKMISGICEMARKYNKPVWAICGINKLTSSQAEKLGITSIQAIKDDDMSLSESMANTGQLLEKVTRSIFTNHHL